MARTFQDWNFFNTNVQQGMQEGRYVNAAFTLLAAGPARLAASGAASDLNTTNPEADFIFPIGVVQNFSIGQNSSVMRVFEMGSERSYFIRGRTVGNLALGRILYHGPSLLRVLYAANRGSYKSDAEFHASESFEPLTGTDHTGLFSSSGGGTAASKQKNYQFAAGEPKGNLWLNLASDVFSQPIGLALFLKDSNADIVGAYYFEYCHVTNHGFGTEAGGTIISENCGITYERMIPLDMQAVSVISDEASLNLTGTVGSAL